MADPDDVTRVSALLGRTPRAEFSVAVRDADGAPVVIRNAPFLDDGTPLPTTYWLVDPELSRAIARLEADGGVRVAQETVDPDALAATHARYAAERDAAIDADHEGPRPFGGVGGTRLGVKCLHAHYAYRLAGGDDPVGDWVAGALALGGAGRGADVVRAAAIDIGTNSTRLLVAEVGRSDGPLVALDRRMTITRLGQGVDATRRLAPEAIARTVDALREYRSAIDAVGDVAAVRATATSAARDAENRDDFFTAAADALGVTPELLSGSEEARLSFLGATTGLADVAPAPYLVVDIGGGSTEFVVGTEEPEGLLSVDIGCVRLTETWLQSDPPTAEELSQAVHVVREHLADVQREVPAVATAKTLVGLAGTVSSFAMIELGLPVYDRDRVHHFRLTKAAAEDVFRTLATEPAADRRHNPGLEPGRVDVIVGGAVILVSVLRTFGFDELLASESDILDGLVRDMTDR